MSTTVVLTRPRGKNEALEAALAGRGLNVLTLPALIIEPCPGAVDAVLPRPGDYDLVVFVSGRAFQSYLALSSARGEPIVRWPAATWAATVGAASAAALRRSGIVPDGRILHPDHASSQDSEALWTVLEPYLDDMKRILIVRGQAGREWLGERLEAAGKQVSRYSAYQRVPAEWSKAQTMALRGDGPVVFVATSAQGLDAILENVRRLGLHTVWEHAKFVVIHERIAKRLQSAMKAQDTNSRPAFRVCAPCDRAIVQAVVSLVSPYPSS